MGSQLWTLRAEHGVVACVHGDVRAYRVSAHPSQHVLPLPSRTPGRADVGTVEVRRAVSAQWHGRERRECGGTSDDRRGGGGWGAFLRRPGAPPPAPPPAKPRARAAKKAPAGPGPGG